MADIPEMTPSAEERLGSEPSAVREGRHFFLDSGVVRLQEQAFRDGARAERKRLLAMLQSSEVAEIVRRHTRGEWSTATGILVAIAAKLGEAGR